MSSAVAVVELSFTRVLCDAGAGFGSAAACVSSAVGRSWGWDMNAAGAVFLRFWVAPRVEWRGAHMSLVRSMVSRLFNSFGFEFVSSQVRSMMSSCGDRAAVSMFYPARSLFYSGTIAPVQEGNGYQPRKTRAKTLLTVHGGLWPWYQLPPAALTQALLPHSPQGSHFLALAQSRPGCLLSSFP